MRPSIFAAPSLTLRVLLISTLLVVPCFWQQHLVAGDLGSHTYNAWLAQLIEQKHAPGLYLAAQSNNILCDLALPAVARLAGFALAERMVAAISALVFFWGAFCFIRVAARWQPWAITPLLAMFCYGYTFQMGFLNFYLSVGLGFFALALIWRGSRVAFIAAALVAILAWLAHPVGFLWFVAAGAYLRASDHLPKRLRPLLFALAAATLLSAHFFALRLHPAFWESSHFWMFNGADQLILFGPRYLILFFVVVVLAGSLILKARKEQQLSLCRSSLELWALMLLAAALLPELVVLPQYAAPASFLIVRSTSITAVLALSVLAAYTPRKSLFVLSSSALCAVVFFAFLYQDTSRLNTVASQAEQLLKTLPAGTRVVAALPSPADWRVAGLQHMVDRACIGHCFVYSNYEPATGQFRIRVRPDSPIATDSPRTVVAMETGTYLSQPDDPPLTQITWCDNDAKRLRLCARPQTSNDLYSKHHNIHSGALLAPSDN